MEFARHGLPSSIDRESGAHRADRLRARLRYSLLPPPLGGRRRRDRDLSLGFGIGRAPSPRPRVKTAVRMPAGSWPKAAALACLLLSGAAGLVYEVCWIRRASLVFGSTQEALSTVL